MSFIINATNPTGEIGTIIADMGFYYSDNLNSINKGSIKISGSSEVRRSLLSIGSDIKIYRNGTLEFRGIVDYIDYFEGGGIVVNISGYEKWLSFENGAYAGSPWIATASATIFSAVLNESTKFNPGTVDTGTAVDFRANVSDSLWNVINNLTDATQQDIGIDYINSEIDILDHKGSSTSVGTFNAKIQIEDVRISQSYPIGNYVRVYGKGDGENQIKSTSAHGQDATSQATYGIITKIVQDPKIMSEDQANILADALLDEYKDPIKVYDFDVLDANQSIVSGDVITLNAKAQGISNEEVRVVSIKRGENNGTEFLTLEVTNAEYSRKIKTANEKIAQLEKLIRDQQTHMQGTTNILTFSDMINANSTLPLRVIGNVNSSDMYDEAGNRRINSFLLDYDVDPYRRSVGTATETNVAPEVAGSSANTEPVVSGTSSSSTPTTTGVVSVWAATQETGRTAATYVEQNYNGSGVSYYTTRSLTLIYNGHVSTVSVDAWVEFPSGSTDNDGNYNLGAGEILRWNSGQTSSSNISGFAHFDDDNRNATHWTGTLENVYSHTHGSHYHGDGSYTADNHHHEDGSYAAGSHNHSVSVGDGVSDSGAINATQVSIYVDFWNTGTSAWVNKHSILNTGKTLDTDVDISNSNTLPDAAGFWRVRIITDNATPDLVQAVIKVKHQLDT